MAEHDVGPSIARARTHLELDATERRGPTIAELQADRVTIGRAGADVRLTDPTVSRLHAVLEAVRGGWVVEDLASRNGTFVNGTRLFGRRPLHDGDTVRFGAASAVFRCARVGPGGATRTGPLDEPPALTARERDAVIAVCRPMLKDGILAVPASVRDVAAELTITESGAKKLLSRAYDRFDLHDHHRTRSRLASEAIRRGAVSVEDLRR